MSSKSSSQSRLAGDFGEAANADAVARQQPPLGREAVRGMAWMSLAVIAAKLCSMLGQFVLAALLLPGDWGLAGLTFTVSSFAGIFANPGLGDVLIARQRRWKTWVTPAFSLAVAVGLVASLVALLLAPVAAAAYDSPPVAALVAVVALAIPLSSLAVVPDAALRIALRFRTLATVSVVLSVFQPALAILLAWLGMGAYSIVVPIPAAALLRATMLWALARPQLRPQLRLGRWRWIAVDSSRLLSTRLLMTMQGQADYVILGLMSSEASVGIYYFGFNLAAQAPRLAAQNFYAVLYPMLARLQQEPQRQIAATLRVAGMVAFIAIPVSLLQAVVAKPLLMALAGDRWLDAVPIIQILSIGIGLASPGWIAEPLARAQGRFALYLRILVPFVILFLALCWAGTWLADAVGLATAVAFYTVVQQVGTLCLVLKSGGHRFSAVLSPYSETLPAAFLAAGSSALIVHGLEVLQLQPALQVISGLSVGMGIYGILTWFVARHRWDEIRQRVWR